jgi:peptidoglycan hydrolase-like protein with peptidoglycan-binding domain
VLRVAVVLALALALAPSAAAAPPALAATASVQAGATPLTVVFRAEGDAVAYAWDLGDGTHVAGAEVEHVYERPGRYVAVVTAIGASGETSRVELVVTAYSLTLEAPRVADHRAALRLTGTVRPATAGARIVLERNGRAVGSATVTARGTFAARVVATAPGTYTARFGDVVSPPRRVALRPALTARVDGAGVVGQPLRLLARITPAAAGTLEVIVLRDGRRIRSETHGASASLPLATSAQASFELRLRVVPAEGWAGRTRTLRATVALPNLSAGSRGPSVLALKRRLAELRYALPRVDGHYGLETTQAVLAFQKVHGLPQTGRVDPRVWRELRRASAPRPRHAGTHIEVSKGRQLLFVVQNGRVESIVHVSTGATGNTPIGTWQIYRKVPGWDWVLWYPMYFLRGFAIHGYPSVPAYPASHGCVRVPMWIAPQLYSRFAHGQLVRVYW